jgi:hypothetical protein
MTVKTNLWRKPTLKTEKHKKLMFKIQIEVKGKIHCIFICARMKYCKYIQFWKIRWIMSNTLLDFSSWIMKGLVYNSHRLELHGRELNLHLGNGLCLSYQSSYSSQIWGLCHGLDSYGNKISLTGLTFIGRTVQHLYQRMYFSLAERYNVCTAASYLC